MANEESKPTHGDGEVLRRLAILVWRELDRNLRLRIAAVAGLGLVTAVLLGVAPVLFREAVDAFAPDPLAVPVAVLLAYVLMHALARATSELRWTLYGRLEQRVQRRLTLRIADHIHSLSLRYQLSRKQGGLQQIVGNALIGYRMILFHSLFIFLPLVFEFGAMATVLVGFYAPVYLAILAATAFLFVASFVIGVKRQRVPQRAATAAYVDAFARLGDSYVNYETIKYFGAERLLRAHADEALVKSEDGWSSFYNLRTVIGLVQGIWLTLGLAALVFLAAREVAAGTMTLGDFVLVSTYLLQLARPLDNLGFAWREVKTGVGFLEKALELLDERPEIADVPGSRPLPDGPGEVEFANVTFAYDERRGAVLEDVSLRVPAGRTVAVVGASGSGKSTLARLLFRFYDVTEGSVTVDGVPVRATTLESLRAVIAVVPQDTALFNDTLLYNIGIGRGDATREEIERAAGLAEIHDFIAGLPDGYHTVVGERGLKLSGGEKQRVAIARAVLKHPRIFVFDEATSALDTGTERAIQKNLERISRGTTTLIIAHRLSTVVHADEIVVLLRGRVAERGRHTTLLAKGGVYAEMWRRQQDETAHA
jgi:ATP-binding cassette subfamily B protein